MKDLIYGPINKSLHTQKFELLVKCILQSPHAIHYDVHKDSNGKDALFAQIAQTQINVSSLVQKINFNHLSFSQADSLQCLKQFNYSQSPSTYFNKQEHKYSNLTTAEKNAIYGYTDLNYIPINSFLHGKFIHFLQSSYCNKLDDLSNALITNIGFLTSGLNKIMPETGFCSPTFRGEHEITFEEVVQRIQYIKQENEVDTGHAFMSTSINKSIGEIFSEGCIIEFEMPYGKDISGLSRYNGESEYLLNPNHIVWDSYSYQNGTFYFKARVVAPLIEKENEVNSEELKEFYELLDFSEKNHINLDFITEFNKENYIKTIKNDLVLPLKDVINLNAEAQTQASILQKADQFLINNDILDNTPAHIEPHWMTTPLLNYESFHNVNELFQI